MLENRGLELIILAVVVLLLFGAKRLPDSARALGKSLRILKSEVGAMKSDDKAPQDKAATVPAEPVVVPRTIQAAPGEAATARPVAEPVAQPQPTNQA
ncbi:Sec-independent protein translocase subunit TatA [Streptacidiphilus sp. N1-12]|uniref:Sec-independent protein translocase protein TatA n=2 Tax=Streptacidiphilus alkalitolerans TaxID=3342712 RepID=A0ABV6WWY9_9ACTN